MSRELSHKIELVLTTEQEDYCKKACGAARFTWNWALNAWNEAFARGEVTPVRYEDRLQKASGQELLT